MMVELNWCDHTFSQPSGGSRARNRLIRFDGLATNEMAPSSGDVLWLPSSENMRKRNRLFI